MNCPHCNIELKISARKNIEIDYCSKCRGVWLDRGELDKLIESSANEFTVKKVQVKESIHKKKDK